MTNNYSPSVNIVRDLNKQIEYIQTPNTIQLYNQILSNYRSGIHSFNIIGSYGTGKSSFIWALEQHLNSKKSYFSDTNKFVDEVNSFEYLPIIGSYESISVTFSEILGCKEGTSVQNIVKAFSNYYDTLRGKNKGLFIAIDEFGKFLEYATKNNPENELYFIQLLAEYINNFDNKIIFVTALHQGFISYSYGLSRTQINEWDKVKGRFKEITFNEPVEQLLLLASKRLNSVSKNPNLAPLFEEISKANIFPLNDYFNIEFAKSIQPFDILSAAILTKALQRYGQNERSLFQFIDTDDYLGLNDFDKSANPFYNIACVYDYLIHNNYSFITSKYNPDYIRWATINRSVEKGDTWKALLASSYSSVPNKNSQKLKDNTDSKTADKKKSNTTRKAMISVLTKDTDITNGATFWDGTDFLAWGTDENKYDSATKIGHNKFKEYKFIEIPKDVYDTFLEANESASTTYTMSKAHDLTKCSGTHVHTKKKGKDGKEEYTGKIKYPMPASVFENDDYWSDTCFYYDTGVKATNGLSATISAGKSIFWKTTKDRLCTDSTKEETKDTNSEKKSTSPVGLPEDLIQRSDNTRVVIPKRPLDLEITEIKNGNKK